MAEYKVVLKTSDLKEGEMKEVEVGGRQLLIGRAGGKFYAAQRFCPHMGGDLPKGKLAGTVVTCPRHGSQFDLKDGRVVRWTDWSGLKLAFAKLMKSPRPLPVYPVKVEGDKVLVEV